MLVCNVLYPQTRMEYIDIYYKWNIVTFWKTITYVALRHGSSNISIHN